MSYEDDNEKHEFELFGLKFRGTYRQQRSLWLGMNKDPIAMEWSILWHQVQHGRFQANEDQGLCERLSAVEMKMTALAAKLIDLLD